MALSLDRFLISTFVFLLFIVGGVLVVHDIENSYSDEGVSMDLDQYINETYFNLCRNEIMKNYLKYIWDKHSSFTVFSILINICSLSAGIYDSIFHPQSWTVSVIFRRFSLILDIYSLFFYNLSYKGLHIFNTA